MARMDKLIPYYRQSKAKEKTYSISDQVSHCEGFAARPEHGVQLLPPVIEGLRPDGKRRDASGAKHWREREIGAVLEAIERGEADGLIVGDQDRLSREKLQWTAELWEELANVGGRLVCVLNNIDTATGDHELIYNLNALINREQWKKLRDNWRRAKENAKRRGVFLSVAPTGYLKDAEGQLRIDPVTGEFVIELFERRAQGWGWAQIARWANENGRPTMSPTSIRQIIINPTYIGKPKQGGTCPALIGRDSWEAAQSTRRSYRPKGSGATAGRTLAQGLAKCGSCGSTLQCQNDRGVLTLACFNHRCEAKARIRVKPLEQYILQQLEDEIMKDDRKPALVNREAEKGLRAVETAEQEQRAYAEQLPKLLAAGLDPTIMQEQAEALADKLEAARAQLAEATRADELANAKRTFRQIFNRDRLRRIVWLSVERITVEPARGVKGIPIEDRVSIDWGIPTENLTQLDWNEPTAEMLANAI